MLCGAPLSFDIEPRAMQGSRWAPKMSALEQIPISLNPMRKAENMLFAKLCKVCFQRIAEMTTSRSIGKSGLKLLVLCFAENSNCYGNCFANESAARRILLQCLLNFVCAHSFSCEFVFGGSRSFKNQIVEASDSTKQPQEQLNTVAI